MWPSTKALVLEMGRRQQRGMSAGCIHCQPEELEAITHSSTMRRFGEHEAAFVGGYSGLTPGVGSRLQATVFLPP